MTDQEIFDTVVAHLRQQNCRAILSIEQSTTLKVGRGICAYKAEDGSKCAAGCLFTNEEYDPRMEAQTLVHILSPPAGFARSLQRLQPHYPLIVALQAMHDSRPIDGWEKDFHTIANQFHLAYYTSPLSPL